MMLLSLTFALAALQLADWHTTRTILANGGREQNPISKWFIDSLGLDEFLILKGIAVVIAGFQIGLESVGLLTGLVVIYAVVILHNWKSMP